MSDECVGPGDRRPLHLESEQSCAGCSAAHHMHSDCAFAAAAAVLLPPPSSSLLPSARLARPILSGHRIRNGFQLRRDGQQGVGGHCLCDR